MQNFVEFYVDVIFLKQGQEGISLFEMLCLTWETNREKCNRQVNHRGCVKSAGSFRVDTGLPNRSLRVESSMCPVSRPRRCCGSMAAASAGERPKNAASNRSRSSMNGPRGGVMTMLVVGC